MKKLLFVCALLFTGSTVLAQNITVTDVYFTDQSSSRINDNELQPGDTVILWFSFDNDLDTALATGDSLTFGWSISGVDQGTLIMSSLNQDIAIGGTVNAFLRTQYLMPDSGSFEICAWPLYNPYRPNTDPMTGRFCNGNFEVELPGPPSLIDELSAQYQSEVRIENGALNFSSNGNTQVSIYDLQGRLVVNTTTSNGYVHLPEIGQGTFIIRLMDQNGMRSSKLNF
jgi:hypothetical protein